MILNRPVLYTKKSTWTVEKVEEIQKIIVMCNPLSLEAPITANGPGGIEGGTLGDFIKDPSPTPEERAIKSSNKRMLLGILEKCLGPKEMRIIKMRFGFEGQPMTLEEIGKEFNLTRERIRQVEGKALIKIRRYMRSHEMFKRSDWDVE